MIITITGDHYGTGRTATAVNIARRLLSNTWKEEPIDKLDYLHEKRLKQIDLSTYPFKGIPNYSLVSDILILNQTQQ